MQLVKILLANYNLIFYGCVFWNLSVILILLIRGMYLISFIFSLSMLIVLILNKLISVGNLNIYAHVHRRILFINIILLIFNFINIFFNMFRYLCYDIIKIIREFIRMILLNYFGFEIPVKIDFYLDNIIAYVSLDAVYSTIFGMIMLIFEYLICTKIDWRREEIILTNVKLRQDLFWCFKNDYFLNLSRFCSIYWRLFISVILYDYYFHINNRKLLLFFVILYLVSVIGAIIFWIQYTIMWYWFLYRKNEEYK